MENGVPAVRCQIQRISGGTRGTVEDYLLREEEYRMELNGKNAGHFFCLPQDLIQLALGYSLSRGLISRSTRLLSGSVEEEAGLIRVATRPGPTDDGAGEDIALTAEQVHRLQDRFEERCGLYRQTGAAHSVALSDGEEILIFKVDGARHNALDKVVGEMLMEGVSPRGKVLIFSGRIARIMASKTAASGVRMIIAPGAPTCSAVELCESADITLLGFVRRDNINIYTHPQRVLDREGGT